MSLFNSTNKLTKDDAEVAELVATHFLLRNTNPVEGAASLRRVADDIEAGWEIFKQKHNIT